MDQLYFEQGYLEDGYYTIIREAELALTVTATATAAVTIADATGYYIPDYIAVDYFVSGGALIDATGSWSSEFQVTGTIGKLIVINSELVSESTQTALVGRILEAAAEFTSAFTPTLTADAFKNSTAILDVVADFLVDAVANRSANVLLEHIADLNAMAAKTVDVTSPMAASTTVTLSATVQLQTSAALSSTASLSCSALNVQFASAAFTARSTMLPAADRARIFFRYNPLNLSTNIPSIDKTEYKFGTGALKLLPSSTAVVVNTTTLPVGYFDVGASNEGINGNYSNSPNFAVSWWQKQSGGSQISTAAIRIQDSTFSSGGNYLQINYNGSITIRRSGNTQSSLIANYNQSFSRTEWNYYEFITYWVGSATANQRRFVLRVNGVQASNSGISPAITDLAGSFTLANNPTVRFLAHTSQTVWVDDARIVIAQTNWNYNANSQTWGARPAPTAEQGVDISNSATKVLLNFNNNFHDLVGTALLQTAAANITAQSTVTAQANANTKIGSAALNSTATVTANATKLVEGSASADSASTVTVTATRVKSAASDLNSNASIEATVGSIKQFNIEVNALFTPNFDADVQRAGVALLESAFEQTAQAVKTVDAISTQVSTAELAVTSTVTLGVSADFSTTSATSIDGERLRFGSSDLSTEANISVDFLKLRPATADLSSAVTVIADAARFRTTQIATDVQSTVTANVDRFRLTTGDFSVDTEVTVTATRIQEVTVQLSAEFQQTTNAIKDTDVVATAVAEVTQTTIAVKTVDALPQLESIATQLTVAFKNATGTVLLESSSTVTAFAGKIINAPIGFGIGVSSDSEDENPDRTPFLKYGTSNSSGSSTESKFVMNMWVYKPIGYIFDADPNRTAYTVSGTPGNLDRLNSSIRVENSFGVPFLYYYGQGGFAVWPLGSRQELDQDYRHFLISVDLSKSTNSEKYRFWLDGQEVTDLQVYSIGGVGAGTVFTLRTTPYNIPILAYGQYHLMMNTTNLAEGSIQKLARNGSGYGDADGNLENRSGLTQFWWDYGGTYDLTTDGRLKFYNGGYVDLGEDGTRSGLSRPKHYVRLLNIQDIDQGGTEGDNWSWRKLRFTGNSLDTTKIYVIDPATPTLDENSVGILPGIRASFFLTAQAQAVLVTVGSLTATSTLTALGSFRIDNAAELVAIASQTVTPTTRIGILADLVTEAEITATVFRQQLGAAALTSTATLAAIVGATEQFDSALSAAFELQADFDVKPPVRAEAALTAEFSLVSDPNTFTDNTALIMTVGDLVCEITVIPPIRIEADLVSEFTVTATIGAIEQFAVLTQSFGTLNCTPVAQFDSQSALDTVFALTTTADRFLGISNLVLQSNGFQVTVGDVINIDPFLQLKITQETRRVKILPESRTLNIEQETRTLLIKGHP